MGTIIQYLNNSVNCSTDISELLKVLGHTTNSQIISLYYYENNSYDCIEQVSLDDHNIPHIIYKCTIPTDNLLIDTSELQGSIPINNSMVIPIHIKEICMGVVILCNRTQDYDEHVITDISPAITILQLILEKEALQKTNSILRQMSSKDLFLANMSHEIRTPLNGVIGYNQLMLQTELNLTQKKYLDSMNHCSIQLMQIINDILDFSKLSSNKMGTSTDCFHVNEVMEAVLDAVGQRIKEKRQIYSLSVSDDIPDFIILDKQKLIQILVNIVSNANKFTDIGGTISIDINLIKPEVIQIIVTDNGIGISTVDQERIFCAFEQLKDYSNTSTGTGLGLAISRKLSTLLGGDLQVQSYLGKGSKFTITAKFSPYEDFEKTMSRDSTLLHGKTVLVVDGQMDNRILLNELLFEWKMIPVVCASSLEALRIIMGNRYNFDIGLIDICMPGTLGAELAQQIKEEKPYLPLIAISSIHTFINTKNFECKLDKPIQKVQLFNNMYHILAKSQVYNAYIGEDCITKTSPRSVLDKSVRILIAEDIIYNRHLLTNMLENMKYSDISIAENGKVAFDMMEYAVKSKNPYQILLLDLRMPIMDGIQVIKKYKEMGWSIPHIVVVTASIMDSDIQTCKDNGIKYFLNKPIQFQQLKDVMLHLGEQLA